MAVKIKKVGFWNYKDLYSFCFDWFKDAGYGIKEEEYVEKNSDAGKEIQLKWSADKKVTDYFKNTISIKWNILGMNSAEVERDGKKEKTNKGEVTINVDSELKKDYEKSWEGKPFVKFMRGLYDNYIIKTTGDEYAGSLSADVKEFVSQVKAFLEL